MRYTVTVPLYTSKPASLDMKAIIKYREKHRPLVEQRLKDFHGLRNSSNHRIFCELSYCILTPQSNALSCDRAVVELERQGILLKPHARVSELEDILKKTRFWRNKTRYLLKAWDQYMADGKDIKKELGLGHDAGENRELRNNIRQDMKGMGIGMKEASHFLRNIGCGQDLAILDRHILNCLSELEVIEGQEASLKSDKDYMRIEKGIGDFCQCENFSMEELDLLLWSAKTGFIYK